MLRTFPSLLCTLAIVLFLSRVQGLCPGSQGRYRLPRLTHGRLSSHQKLRGNALIDLGRSWSRTDSRSRIYAGVGGGVTESADQRANNNATSANESNEFITTTTTYPPTPTLRECLTFALPALGIYICSPLMSLIDASFIGRLSTSTELAALGPASSISDCAPLPLLFLSIASTNLIAKAYAQTDQASCARVTRAAIGMGSACGLLLAVLLYTFARPLSILYCGEAAGVATGASNLMFPACCEYVSIRALALPAVVLTTIAQATLLGTKDTRTPMASVGLAAIANLLGDLILVKGLHRGIAGAAWATSGSQILSAGLLLRALHKRGFLKKEPPTTSIPLNNVSTMTSPETNSPTTWDTVKQLLSFIPFLYIMMVKIIWHNSCSATAASLGGSQAAAHTALFSVAMVCMVLGDVGSSLSQAFLPAFESPPIPNPMDVGETSVSTFNMDAAMPTVKQLLKCTLSISASVTALCGIVIGIFGGQITSDPAVLVEMRKTLPLILTTLCFHGSAVTLEGLLLSRKKFRPLSVCYSILAVSLAAFQIATRRFGLGLAGVWGCYVWFCASRAVTFSALGGVLRPREFFRNMFQRREPAPLL